MGVLVQRYVHLRDAPINPTLPSDAIDRHRVDLIAVALQTSAYLHDPMGEKNAATLPERSAVVAIAVFVRAVMDADLLDTLATKAI